MAVKKGMSMRQVAGELGILRWTPLLRQHEG